MDKMREEFEAWFWDEHHKDSDVELYRDSVFATTVNGDYRGISCHTYWTVWKASRAALCVELPRPTYDYVMECYMMVADYVAKSLYAAGVKFK